LIKLLLDNGANVNATAYVSLIICIIYIIGHWHLKCQEENF